MQMRRPRESRAVILGNLDLERCSHCGIAKPHTPRVGQMIVTNQRGQRWWAMYACNVCGGVILAASNQNENGPVTEYYPRVQGPSEAIPERPREYLRQAQESLSQPAGAVMLCASAVDAILKNKDFKDGSLYDRINQAAKTNLITADMAKWAHQVRLDANDQRHSEETAQLPTPAEAERSLRFAIALAEVLYVIPAQVTRGIEETKA